MIKNAFLGFEVPFHEQSLSQEELLCIMQEEPWATMLVRCALITIPILENLTLTQSMLAFTST